MYVGEQTWRVNRYFGFSSASPTASSSDNFSPSAQAFSNAAALAYGGSDKVSPGVTLVPTLALDASTEVKLSGLSYAVAE